MLTMPQGGASYVSIVAVDPGTETLGVAVLRVSLPGFQLIGSTARTFTGSKLNARVDWTSDLHGELIARIEAHEENLLQILQNFRPTVVACESPFMGKFANSFKALVEMLSAIRRAVMRYDMWTPLDLIDPPTVKNAVGVKGNKGGEVGKALMRDAVLSLAPVLNYEGDVPLDRLDEHSIDALAVGYARYLALRKQLCL